MTVAFSLLITLLSSNQNEIDEKKLIYARLNGEWECTKSFDLENDLRVLSDYQLYFDSSSSNGIQKGSMTIRQNGQNSRPSTLEFEIGFSFRTDSNEITFFDIRSSYLVIEKKHGFINEDSLNNDSNEKLDIAKMFFSNEANAMKLVYRSGEEATCNKNI
ncbi:hypothetical protein [Alteromonas mediterranea]|uniref:hypothetical protein n=1 Tax=Alteromonas mediterranea TaxID=314275 RepID=UPI0003555617|nr:hypothetical protein [Alteromonas mediterranea]AGP84765.1 hypothetical protein I607_04785 [Alteromonas mediterranea U4]AGP88881.1 hypothetical protein I876_05000 [Alteromonas mediterranea U7]AGP93572.1 hypothetical protein I634_09285 [Alteromonas mediterranea U8]